MRAVWRRESHDEEEGTLHVWTADLGYGWSGEIAVIEGDNGHEASLFSSFNQEISVGSFTSLRDAAEAVLKKRQDPGLAFAGVPGAYPEDDGEDWDSEGLEA